MMLSLSMLLNGKKITKMPKYNRFIVLFALLIPCSLLVHSNLLNIVGSEAASLEVKFNTEPQLLNPSVNPSIGTTETTFTFQVTYSDINDDMPSYIRVFINDTVHDMTKQDSSDNTYDDGCIYNYSTTLAVGNYTYFFSTSDGLAHVNSTTYLGPSVTEFSSSSSIPGFPLWVAFLGIIGVAAIIFSLKPRNKEISCLI